MQWQETCSKARSRVNVTTWGAPASLHLANHKVKKCLCEFTLDFSFLVKPGCHFIKSVPTSCNQRQATTLEMQSFVTIKIIKISIFEMQSFDITRPRPAFGRLGLGGSSGAYSSCG